MIISYACKSDVNEQTDSSENHKTSVETEVKELEVVLDFKTNKDDKFKLMLNNIRVDEFQNKNVQIIEKVNQTSSVDKIITKFGDNNISNNFIINLRTKR